uniref:C2H2-type domain-containing protein n=2 Tax=Clastoptera arizonana TaxID=38151 RepID=A0A1B6D5V8_9HEMI
MNFTPFSTFTGTLPAGHQFTTAKLAHQVSTSSGQVVGLICPPDESGVTYIRPISDGSSALTFNLAPQQAGGNAAQHNQVSEIITIPISLPGNKPGDLSPQTVQIQVVNPGGGSGTGGDKLFPITLQQLQQCGAAVVTLSSYNPQGTEGIQLQLHQTDLENGISNQQQQHNNNNNTTSSGSVSTQTQVIQTQPGMHCNEMVLPDVKPILTEAEVTTANTVAGGQAFPVAVLAPVPQELLVRTEDMDVDKKDKDRNRDGQDNGEQGETYSAIPTSWQIAPGSTVADYFQRLSATTPLSIHHFLKFSAETIKREAAIESSPLSNTGDTDENGAEMQQTQTEEITDDPANQDGQAKKKKKYKKKAPKPRRPRPGQVHIATALDGTTLFCCPECNMAYPDKELLEQHLVAHKIERRFICDICGAGLKRKEHLERHKLGHNPERPYICSVCCKGFKRKEHLNLHFVIHSGEKTEVCPECGKGFYRKDHLRKHARSHLAKRVKDEITAQQQQMQQTHQDVVQQQQTVDDDQQNGVVIENTVVLPTASETGAMALLHQQHHHQQH